MRGLMEALVGCTIRRRGRLDPGSPRYYTSLHGKGGKNLKRIAALALIFIAAIAVFLGLRAGDKPVGALETPELRSAPEIFDTARGQPDEPSGQKNAGMRIGRFERPREVPEYTILEKTTDVRDGTRGARLLVDTRAGSEKAYTLIVRDIKALYADYDAISMEFTDSTETLDYNGAALIFNTPAGAYYMGFIYSPPNNRGYIVDVAE